MKMPDRQTAAKGVVLTASIAIALYLGAAIIGPVEPPAIIILLALMAFGTTLARLPAGAGSAMTAGGLAAGHAVIKLASAPWPSPAGDLAYLTTALALAAAGFVLMRGAKAR